MPTENELKFVLHLNSESNISKIAEEEINIKQAYIAFSKGLSVRVRETIYGDKYNKFELCFKQRVRSRVIEVEKKLEKRDFEDLWEISVNRLEKIRYIVEEKNEIWEVDYFKDHQKNTYFSVAEHEMPEKQLKPNFIPSIIKKYLIYEVPIEDDRFASKRIADIKYSKELYNEVIKEFG